MTDMASSPGQALESVAIWGLLLLAAITLAEALSRMLTPGVAGWPGWLRLPLGWVAQGIAFFPLPAAVWAFVGWWIGKLALPIETLMAAPLLRPLTLSEGLAVGAWRWLPPVWLLTLPLAAHLLSRRLLRKSLSPSTVAATAGLAAELCLIGTLAAAAVNTALTVVPGGSAPGMAMAPDRLPWSILAAPAAAAAATCLMLLALRALATRGRESRHVTRRHEPVLEGALAIGMPRGQAWRRHVLPSCLRRWCKALLRIGAWLMFSHGCIQWLYRRDTAFLDWVFASPHEVLLSATPTALWSLSFWLVGGMVGGRIFPPHDRVPA